VSVWTDRDLVVLEYLHHHPRHEGIVSTNCARKQPHPDLPSLSQQDVHVAIETLADEGLVSYRTASWSSGGGVHWIDLQVTGSGLQALGEWPVFEALNSPEELGGLLDALAEMAATDEEESNLHQAASVARSKGKDALQALVAGAFSAITRSHLG
jgi:hypothetical protein